METKYGRNSFFDGGLLSFIGWNVLGFIVTLCTLGFAIRGHCAWSPVGKLIIP